MNLVSGKSGLMSIGDREGSVWMHPSVKLSRARFLFMRQEVLVAVKLGASSVADSFRRGDRWICDLTGDGEFKVKAVRNSLDDLFLPSQAVATRWVKFIPIKVNVFAWRARRDRLPTRLNLSRRGVVLDSILCPLCDADVEDVHHVMFRCDMALSVLRKICWWWELDWQVLSSFSDWNGWFLSIRLPSFIKSILEGVFCVAWWRIWMFRNQLIFDASPPRRSVVFDDIVSWSFNLCVLVDVDDVNVGNNKDGKLDNEDNGSEIDMWKRKCKDLAFCDAFKIKSCSIFDVQF
ncbi:RNA-directed DNA polymerase, eukaryota [Tanacetum coccineum]